MPTYVLRYGGAGDGPPGTPAVSWHSVVPTVLAARVRAWTERTPAIEPWSGDPLRVEVGDADIAHLPPGEEANDWAAGDPILAW